MIQDLFASRGKDTLLWLRECDKHRTVCGTPHEQSKDISTASRGKDTLLWLRECDKHRTVCGTPHEQSKDISTVLCPT
jgi:predicted secreted protein